MNDNEKTFLVIVAALMSAVCIFVAYRMFSPNLPNIKPPNPAIEEEIDEPEPAPKSYVNVFFIGQNDSKEEVYKAVKREYNEAEPKLKFAVTSLVAGPNAAEKAKGVYSEIPVGTRVLDVTETPDKVIINLSSTFETGGGTYSLYKRIYQLIKTAKKNTNKPVYLHIEGKKADVIGGEGIMLSQPLNEKAAF
jgi:spore germination protein GerM